MASWRYLRPQAVDMPIEQQPGATSKQPTRSPPHAARTSQGPRAPDHACASSGAPPSARTPQLPSGSASPGSARGSSAGCSGCDSDVPHSGWRGA